MLEVKISLNIKKLASKSLFLGYSSYNWNPRINYFLLGKKYYTYPSISNIINLNFTYTMTKKMISILSELFTKNCSLWLINDNFEAFDKLDILKEITEVSSWKKSVTFWHDKWIKGFLTNYKTTRSNKKYRFPQVIFFPNLTNNIYTLNECNIVGVPFFSLVDTNENPNSAFHPIPSNSKDVNSLVFFYVMLCKVVVYSKHVVSASFCFDFYRKGRLQFKQFIKNFTLSYFNRLNNLCSINFINPDDESFKRLLNRIHRIPNFYNFSKKKQQFIKEKLSIVFNSRKITPVFIRVYLIYLRFAFINFIIGVNKVNSNSYIRRVILLNLFKMI